MFNRKKNRPVKSKPLPHLSNKGMALPEVPVSDRNIRMPGQKPLPNAEWRNQADSMGIPISQGNSERRTTVEKQGLSWTERSHQTNEIQPPPKFMAAPSRKASILHVRESNSQKQVYRMDSGVDPVSLLSSRLEAWQFAVKSMVGLFKKIAATEEKSSKGYMEASKEIVVPFEKATGHFLEVGAGGVHDVWATLRNYALQHGSLEHDSVAYIEKSVLPALRAIKSDIKTMHSSIQKDKDLKSEPIFDGRLKIDKLIGRLDRSIESCHRSPQQADQTTDPFLLNLGIIQAVRELCDSENNLHDNILNLQKEVALFEEKIIENCRYILLKFQDFRVHHKLENKQIIDNLVVNFNSIEPSLEWNEFVRRHEHSLVAENAVHKSEDMIEYPNQHHPLTRAIKLGPLDSKSGSLKGYSSSMHILTPAGFLHGYKSQKEFEQSPIQPAYSVFIPGSEIEYHEKDGSFQIRNNNKKISMSLGSTYHFRPSTVQEGRSWIAELNVLADQHKIVPLFDPTSPTLPQPKVMNPPKVESFDQAGPSGISRGSTVSSAQAGPTTSTQAGPSGLDKIQNTSSTTLKAQPTMTQSGFFQPESSAKTELVDNLGVGKQFGPHDPPAENSSIVSVKGLVMNDIDPHTSSVYPVINTQERNFSTSKGTVTSIDATDNYHGMKTEDTPESNVIHKKSADLSHQVQTPISNSTAPEIVLSKFPADSQTSPSNELINQQSSQDTSQLVSHDYNNNLNSTYTGQEHDVRSIQDDDSVADWYSVSNQSFDKTVRDHSDKDSIELIQKELRDNFPTF